MKRKFGAHKHIFCFLCGVVSNECIGDEIMCVRRMCFFTIEHSMEIRADGCQDHFMSWDGHICDSDDDVTQLQRKLNIKLK